MSGFGNLAGSTFTPELFDDNFTALEIQNTFQHGRGIIDGLTLSAGAAFTLNIAAGRMNGLYTVYLAATTHAMPASSTRYVFIDEAGAVNDYGTDADPGGTAVCLGKVVTDGAGIVSVSTEGRIDLWRWTAYRMAKLGDNLLVASLTSGANRIGIGKVPTQGTFDLSGSAYISSDLDIGAGGVRIDATNDRIGIRNIAPSDAIDITNGHIRINHLTPPGAPTVALAGAGAGSVTNGVHYYKITFVTADGETEAGTASASVNVVNNAVNGKVSITGIPVSASPYCTARKIYRTAAGGTTYKLLATIADNTTTTYTDNIADGSLGAYAPAAGTTGGQIRNGATPAILIDQTGRMSHQTHQRESVNVQTLSATRNLAVSDASMQLLDPNGADRIVNLPDLGTDTNNFGAWFWVQNTGGANNLDLREPGGATVALIGAGNYYLVRPRPSSGLPIWPTGGPYATTAVVT